tara:strand:- start:5545 stop:6816 length:1272 start_codon:yes stop_codon:yes gene_type:complete
MKLLALFVLTLSSLPLVASEEKTLLKTLEQEALSNNPEIKLLEAQRKASFDVPSRMESLPDPMLQLSAQNFRTDDFKYNSSAMSAYGIGVMQKLPFPGKLSRKGEIASSYAKVVSNKEKLGKAEVIFELHRAYWNLYFAQIALKITEENVKVIDVLTGVAINRMKVAKVAQQDALQAQVAHSKLRSMQRMRKSNLENSKRVLNRIIGKSENSNIQISDSPKKEPIKILLDDLEKALKVDSPQITTTDLMVKNKEKSLEEAKYDRLPDFQLGVNYRVRDEIKGDMTKGADMVSISVGITIPLWMGSKQNARVSENVNHLMAAKSLRNDVHLKVTTRLRNLIERINSLNDEINLFQKEVLKKSSKALNASINDYKSAKVGFVSVVRNWRSDLDFQLEYEKMLVEREITFSEIMFITGKSVRRLSL